MPIRENLERVQERIREAARKAGRNPAEVKLILVSKNVSVEKIEAALSRGVRDFGENRVQELLTKKPHLPTEIQWHFIGHLQTNKVKSLLGEIALHHSLDRMELAETIQKEAEKRGLHIEALLQVNVSGEKTKSGFAPEALESAVEKIRSLDRIHIHGLMTIGPLTDDLERIRANFRALRSLRDKLQKEFQGFNFHELSMGMSSDFEWAIEEGATMVRVGSAVFGERK